MASDPNDSLSNLLEDRILILDGAMGTMGTMVHRYQPTEETYRGEPFKSHPIDLKNAADVLVISQPQFSPLCLLPRSLFPMKRKRWAGRESNPRTCGHCRG